MYGKKYFPWKRNLSNPSFELYRTPMLVSQCSCRKNGDVFPICPRCDMALERSYQQYCDRCGQALDWSLFAQTVG